MCRWLRIFRNLGFDETARRAAVSLVFPAVIPSGARNLALLLFFVGSPFRLDLLSSLTQSEIPRSARNDSRREGTWRFTKSRWRDA
jgi:hypothetical protein